jgi:hypothetical protein
MRFSINNAYYLFPKRDRWLKAVEPTQKVFHFFSHALSPSDRIFILDSLWRTKSIRAGHSCSSEDVYAKHEFHSLLRWCQGIRKLLSVAVIWLGLCLDDFVCTAQPIDGIFFSVPSSK